VIAQFKLDALVGLAETADCRRARLLGYFGEAFAGKRGNCDNCLTPPNAKGWRPRPTLSR